MEGRLVAQYREIHADREYGISGKNLIEPLSKVIDKESKSILDYGCGRAGTAEGIGKLMGITDIVKYDPAIPEYADYPDRDVDTVICTDVLEHVPEEELDNLFAQVWGYADKEVIFVIALQLAGEILPNGENAHCTVKPKEWWEKQLSGVWTNVEYLPQPPLSKNYKLATFRVTS